MDIPDLQAAIRIDAPPEQVWELVSDVRNMSRWSPQVDSTRLRAGFDVVALGAQFTNRNSAGELTWTTHAEIVHFEPPRRIAFRVAENWVVWSFTLAPDDGGTLLTQRREAPEGVSDLSVGFVESHLGGTERFADSMRDGVNTTLERIRTAAEA